MTPSGILDFPGGATQPGADPIGSYPLGIEMGVKYALVGPSGLRAVINDPTDRDFVGYLSEPPTGLEGADIREAADDNPEQDGGIHGAFWSSRLAFTLTGIVYPDAGAAVARQAKLLAATDAKRADAQLLWTPSLAPPVMLNFRAQRRTRITNRRPKTFFVAGVSADPLIVSQALQTQQFADTASCTNIGQACAWPLITLYGPLVNPVISNTSFGGALALNLTLPTAADFVAIDTHPNRRSIRLGNAATNVYGSLAFATSSWFGLNPGADSVLTVAPATGLAVVQWRHSWGG